MFSTTRNRGATAIRLVTAAILLALLVALAAVTGLPQRLGALARPAAHPASSLIPTVTVAARPTPAPAPVGIVASAFSITRTAGDIAVTVNQPGALLFAHVTFCVVPDPSGALDHLVAADAQGHAAWRWTPSAIPSNCREALLQACLLTSAQSGALVVCAAASENLPPA